MFCTRHNARTNSPTATSKTTAAATSATTKADRIRSAPRPPNTRPPWRKSALCGPRDNRHAGISPKPTPVARVASAATASILRSALGAAAIGSVVGTRAATRGTASTASPTPASPPPIDSRRLSVSTWRAMRRGRAPIATRTASSR